MTRYITNEVDAKATYAGTEATPGVAVAPDYLWPGELAITKTADLKTDNPQATGGYDRDVTPELDLPTYSGTYAEDLTFETLPMQLQYAVKTGATGVLVGGSSGAYEYVKAPSFAQDDIDSATLQYGVHGLAWQSTGVRHDEFTITIDVDDTDGVWKFSSNLFVQSKTALEPLFDGVATDGTVDDITMTGAGWTVDELKGQYVFLDFGSHTGEVRQIESNTEDTIVFDEPVSTAPGAGTVFRVEANLPTTIPVVSYESIPTYGTKFFIDEYGDPIETEILDRIISFNMTVQSERTTKRFLNNGRDEVSSRSGRGRRQVTGQIRVELDRRDEYYAWETLKQFGLRVVQVGSEIEAGVPKQAEIVIPKGAFSTPNEDARENNMTATFPFRAYLPESEPVFTISAINDLATLP